MKKGTMRLVFLTKNYAVKIPRLKNFIRGWIANKSETHFWKSALKDNPSITTILCPVLYSFGGFILIMPRVDTTVTEEEVSEVWEKCKSNLFLYLVLEPIVENFGKLDGKVVATDYNIRVF